MEEIKQRFDKKFKGQTELSQSILSALEYRGFYDSGKYLDDDISERIAPIILAFIQSEINLAVSKERERAIDKIKHHFNGYGGSLGFTKNELINLINTK